MLTMVRLGDRQEIGAGLTGELIECENYIRVPSPWSVNVIFKVSPGSVQGYDRGKAEQ